jgi:hypothetical protein
MPDAHIPANTSGGDILEQVIIKGDLAKLTPQERVAFYKATCDSVGLNPLTRPLEFITLSGRLVLYARRDAADQLRKINGISVEVISQKVDGDMLTVHVRARDKSGRSDEDFGVVSIAGLRGEARANATLKCITKAKRRVTLSIAGLGFLDETEVDDIPARERSAAPSDTTAELDQFAAVTGEAEPPEEYDLRAEGHDAAERGTELLRAWYRPLSPDERKQVAPYLEELKAIAATADDPFGLPPLAPPEQQQAEPPNTRPNAGPAPGPFPSDAGQPFAEGDVFSQLNHEARAATKEGVVAFRAWWKTVRPADKDLIRHFQPDYEKLAADADAQRGLAL